MKAIMLGAITLAIVAPVFSHTYKLKVWECYFCKSQRISQYEPPASAGTDGCVSSGGSKSNYHNWHEVR